MSAAGPKDKRDNSSDEITYEENKDRQRSYATGHRRSTILSAAERARRNINAKLANPLQGYSYAELKKMGRDYAYKHALAEEEDVRALELGAMLARDPEKIDHMRQYGLTDAEHEVLRKEFTSRWSQPKLLYLVIVLCSTCAAVQGMGMAAVTL